MATDLNLSWRKIARQLDELQKHLDELRKGSTHLGVERYERQQLAAERLDFIRSQIRVLTDDHE